MKHISILVPVGNVIIDTIIGSYNLLKMANAYYKRINEQNEDLFKIDLVGLKSESVQYQGLFSVTPTTTITEIDKTDLIIVTANSGDIEKEIERNRQFIPWIRKQRTKGYQ